MTLDSGNEPVTGSGSLGVDELKMKRFMENIRDNQNLSMGILGGSIAALIGAVIWGFITYITGYQIGWMAIGVGVLVGYGVRLFGKGIDRAFGMLGAGLSLLGCIMGNLFATCIFVAEEYSVSVFQVIGSLEWGIISEMFVASFQPMDVLFYAIAIYEGYKFSFYRASKEELGSVIKQ
jgi:hypothetical protein